MRENQAFLVAQRVKNLAAMQETLVQYLGGEDPWRKEWLPTPVFLPGEFHGQRSLASYSPYSWKESDMTERLILSVRASQNEREKPFQRGLQASSRARLLRLSS